MDYDLIVVGAGPGGSTAARYAAENGARVLLLEKRDKIGYPVRCGEGIAPKWLEFSNIPIDDYWISKEVKGAKIYSPNGSRLVVEDDNLGTEVGLVIDRVKFDQTVADLAVKAGAECRVGVFVKSLIIENNTVKGVEVTSNGIEEKISCNLVIGADGFESQVGRWAGLNTLTKPSDSCGALQYYLTNLNIDPNYCEFYLSKGSKGAYIWSFPKSKTESNVGIGCLMSRVHSPGEIKDLLDDFISNHPDFSKGTSINEMGGGVSLSPPLDKTIRQGIMLVGDAARHIDSITGGGIANACIAGMVAGKVAADSIKSKDHSEEFLEKYENGWRELMEDRLYHSYVAKTKLSQVSPEMIDTVVATMNRVGVAEPTVQSILSVLDEYHPDILKEVGEMI